MEPVHYAPSADSDGDVKLFQNKTDPLISEADSSQPIKPVNHVLSQGPVRELNSDIHLIDKLLYLITPLIFLVTSFTLWTILGALTGSEIKFTCWAPAQFTHEWVEYSNDACHYGQGSLYTPGDLEDPKSKHDHANRINYTSPEDYMRKTSHTDPESYPQTYLLIALLSILPLLAWHLLGRIDGSGTINLINRRNHTRKTGFSNHFSALWLLLCKIGTVIVVAVQYFHAHEVHKEVQSGMDKAVSMARRGVTLPPLLCDFEVRSLGDRIHQHTVQCVVFTGDNISTLSNIVPSMALMASLWIVLVLTAVFLNAVIVLAVYLISFSEKFRDSTIERYLGSDHGLTADHSTVFNLVLAARNGQTLQIQQLLQEAARKVK